MPNIPPKAAARLENLKGTLTFSGPPPATEEEWTAILDECEDNDRIAALPVEKLLTELEKDLTPDLIAEIREDIQAAWN